MSLSPHEENNTQFTLSHDLLHLLQWIIENEPEKLKRLVTKAVHQGIYEKIQKEEQTMEEKSYLYTSIIDFFALMEAFLREASSDYTKQRAREKNVLKDIDHIVCDSNIIRSSLEQATKKGSNSSSAQVKEILFEEILKRWAPHSKKSIH